MHSGNYVGRKMPWYVLQKVWGRICEFSSFSLSLSLLPCTKEGDVHFVLGKCSHLPSKYKEYSSFATQFYSCWYVPCQCSSAKMVSTASYGVGQVQRSPLGKENIVPYPRVSLCCCMLTHVAELGPERCLGYWWPNPPTSQPSPVLPFPATVLLSRHPLQLTRLCWQLAGDAPMWTGRYRPSHQHCQQHTKWCANRTPFVFAWWRSVLGMKGTNDCW